MDECSPAASFSNHQHHGHLPSFPLTFPGGHGPVGTLSPSQLCQDPLDQNRSRACLASYPSSAVKKGHGGRNRVFLSSSVGSSEGDAYPRQSFDGALRSNSDPNDYWEGKKVPWEDAGGSCGRTAEDFHGYEDANDVFYPPSCSSEECDRSRLRVDYDKNGGCEAMDPNMSLYTRQNVYYTKSSHYVEDDLGSSGGSGEEQFAAVDTDRTWLSVSPIGQGEARCSQAADMQFPTGRTTQTSPVGVGYTNKCSQKLDPFSKAFPSHRKSFPTTTSGHSSDQIWEFEVEREESPGLFNSRQSEAYNPNTLSSSPSHPSLPLYLSPPASSHLMPSVLSPPPTPLPPPSHSPSKGDSLGAHGVVEIQRVQQFFASRHPPLPFVDSSEIKWRAPLLSHDFPDLNDEFGGQRSFLQDDGTAETHAFPPAHESTSLTPSHHLSSPHVSRAIRPPSSPSLLPPFHLPLSPSHLSGEHPAAAESIAPRRLTQKTRNDSAGAKLQRQASPAFTGAQFSSSLRSRCVLKRARYTPRPLLNPLRKGTGLYCSISSLHHTKEEAVWGEPGGACNDLPRVNVGPEFQADLIPRCVDGQRSDIWLAENVDPPEQLLWKPFDHMQEDTQLQAQVETLVSLCSSSCLPGGGSNTELALHCLHMCQGDVMATLEMLLFSQHSPSADYHYSGCDVWSDAERDLFTAAFGKYGKDFTFIQNTVRTKSVSQCVEFYYLIKKLESKRKRQEEDESRDAEVELKKNVTVAPQPIGRQFPLEGVVPLPPLASFFPCKLCGKIFYKIKSRNAHMKIHRQPQEDWTERRLQQQILTQRLALSRSTGLMPAPLNNQLPPQTVARAFPSPGLVSNTKINPDGAYSSASAVVSGNAGHLVSSTAMDYSNIAPSSSHIITINNLGASNSNQTQASTFLPFHQVWGSFGPNADLCSFYSVPDGKQDLGRGTREEKETVLWQ